jgi:hypothetical protein
MSKDVDTLAIADKVDKDTLAILRLVYRTHPTIQVVGSHGDVVNVLKGYQSIRRLIFMLEGNSGNLIVRSVLKSLKRYADELNGALTRVQDEIICIRSSSRVADEGDGDAYWYGHGTRDAEHVDETD